ncbi:MAG: enoyl-CoA hydratase, partial [Alphaproteobacteria bacterium]|nr:enoyl-CoA hydratase [Alphaproteobacteria bacterium]
MNQPARAAADPASPLLLRADRNGVVTLTLNRPEARNSLSIGLMSALEDALAAIPADP